MVTEAELIDAARAVRMNAHAPYSNFQVGVAILTEAGGLFVGCNVENVAYPQGTCAEAGAVAAMVASGERVIAKVAVVADSPVPITPCGGCRQKLAEFGCPEVEVILANLTDEVGRMTLGALLPGPFSTEHLSS